MSSTIMMSHGANKNALLCYADGRSHETVSLSKIILLHHMEAGKKKADLL